jgi:hypothetical protein
MEPYPGDMYTFFVITSLMGGQALIPGTMNIARVIHLSRSVTPIIVAIFHCGRVECFLKPLRVAVITSPIKKTQICIF